MLRMEHSRPFASPTEARVQGHIGPRTTATQIPQNRESKREWWGLWCRSLRPHVLCAESSDFAAPSGAEGIPGHLCHARATPSSLPLGPPEMVHQKWLPAMIRISGPHLSWPVPTQSASEPGRVLRMVCSTRSEVRSRPNCRVAPDSGGRRRDFAASGNVSVVRLGVLSSRT